MEIDLISLSVVTIIAFVCPVISSLVPNKMLPESVLLLIAGMIFGEHVLNIIADDSAISLLSDLGLAFLFLLAGYEIEVHELTGKRGRHALATWIASFVIAILVVFLAPNHEDNFIGQMAIAITLTTTAFGTLVPIIHERKLIGTPIGNSIQNYGCWGELMPIIAISVLLSTRMTIVSVVILAIFAIIAIAFAFASKKLKEKESRLFDFIKKNTEDNLQMNVRAVVFMLVGLVALSSIFQLDIVMGAFAAGFILRSVIPKGDNNLESKLNAIGYGFFIPLFFVISGTKIDPIAVIEEPHILILFIISLILIRAVPIYVSLSITKDTKQMTTREKASVSLYCTTALPLIVAVCSVAVSAGAMDQQTSSVLIAAGGLTVLLMPLIAVLVLHTADAELGKAIVSIRSDPRNTYRVLKKHRIMERRANAKRKAKRAQSKAKQG